MSRKCPRAARTSSIRRLRSPDVPRGTMGVCKQTCLHNSRLHVDWCLHAMREPTKLIRVSLECWQVLQRRASLAGLSIGSYVESIAAGQPTKPVQDSTVRLQVPIAAPVRELTYETE